MSSGDVTLRDSSRAALLALLASSATVVAMAIGLDVLADEPPVHTLTLALAATTVGCGRVWLRGRLRGLFGAVNLAVIGQPVVHALTKLTHAGADALPHAHGLPEDMSSVAMHVVVALLVVAVAASEPICAYLGTAVVRALMMITRAPRPVGPRPLTRPRRTGLSVALEQQLLPRRCLTRRGPPPAALLAG